jgi:hypothetical protein
MKFRGFVRRQVATNIVGRTTHPSFCKTLPNSFAHIARKPLHGDLVSGYDARTTARYSYLAGCVDFPELSAFLLAIRGGGGGGGGSGGDGGRPAGDGSGGDGTGNGTGTGEPDCDVDDPSCDGGGAPAPTISNTLKGSGSVTRDAGDPNLFSYSISFNEPVYGYRFELSKVSVHCPAPTYAQRYDECQGLGDSNTPNAGGLAVRCEYPGASQFVYEFECDGPSDGREGSTPQTIPAGTTITGRFKIDAGSVAAGSVKVIGLQAGGAGGVESQPATLSGP